ncbi:MAG: thrombospondin type 3 repeat-containing protein, partial [Verrucomicrobia bacterium]|nr:thrombospondin type 3 repeat-containing protein [Verrucomicrobiota bacterium]
MSERDPASVRFQSRYNCLKVTVNGDVTRIRALGEDGEVFDETTVCIAPHDDAVAYAVRHTPEVESTPADDGDGNIAGQMFDFAGPGIPAISGESSNPGEYYFNYDQYEFFVGIKNVSIFPGQTLFLFIGAEAPNEVCSLEGLGNDVIDPEGQGADGLDFLEHLVFTNFMPMVGCILGDETADGTYRDFDSRGASINTGQGVFHLNPTLDPIAGARLQQFNQSPQTSIVPNEENADFIEVSIPLGVLGNPAPGDEVCVAAVVGLDTVKTNISEQSRRLDSGFFGAGMSADNGISVIRGIRAKLDHDPDGDGMTSYEEAVAGTNPDDPESLLEMYVEQDGEIIEMSWRAATGRVYRVESSLKVNGPFQLLDELIIDGNELTPGGGAVVSITNRIESAQGEFYRLRVDQIPPGG